ncbi:MAG: serine/threonine protein kinase [Myxococcales bacterium]|nr:serine/threonine protein kinase [Myxococcales bacterium]
MSTSPTSLRGSGGSATLPEPGAGVELPPEGSTIGRYVVLGLVGRGGMGVVLRAFDPRLDRKIALKLLHGSSSPDAQARLQREAQALARLSHPNVIRVHDVGAHEGRVFLAMELVTGQTLADWLRAGPREWREVVRVMSLAGEGLAAAHAAGLVHRDFKPANVLLGDDGQVKVTDFGLARAHAEAPGLEPPTAPSRLDLDSASLDATLTRTGALVGTPAYMAPEQRRGEPCGPKADQFSLCVALHEALHGQLPPASSYADASPPHGPALGRWPRRLERLIATGLALDPRDRHPSMRHLVQALDAVLHPRRRRAALVVLAGLGGAGLAWAVRGEPPKPAPPTPCTGSARALADTWSEPRATAVAEALARPDLPWSARVRDEALTRLRAYGDAWIAEHEATCRAARIDGVDSEAVLDLRMACLDRRRRALGALVDVLADADVEVAAQAVQAVDALPDLDGCRDVEALRAPVPLPDDPPRRAQAEALFDRLARVEALRQAKRNDEAAALAAKAVQDAVTLAHPPTEADARLASGWVLTDRGEHEAAEAELRAALHAAEAGHHDQGVALAWSRLAWVVGYKRARFDEGRTIAQHAQAWSRRTGDPPALQLARLRSLGWIEHEAGNAETAATHFEAAVTLAERLPHDDPHRVHELALALNGLGAAALAAADLPRAADGFSRAASLMETALGPDHPDVALVRNNLSSLLRAQGRAQEAHRLLEHNLDVFTATYGDDHPLVGQTLINLAVVELDLGLHAEVERHADRSIALLRAAHGPDHPLVAKGYTIRGDARVQLGRSEAALEDFEHALRLESQTLGPEHPSVGIIESNLGGAYYDLERLDDAAAHQQRSLEILEAALGPDHPNVAFVLVSLALTRRAQGHPDQALPLLRRADSIGDATLRPNALTRIGEVMLDLGREREAIDALEQALALYAEIEHDPGFPGDAHFALARALWARRQPDRARTEAQAALTAYEAGGDAEPSARVRAWLDAHGAAGVGPP